jgi:hypothetical protein
LAPVNALELIKAQQEAAAPLVVGCTGGKFLPQMRLTNPKSGCVESGEVAPYQFVKIVDSEVDHVYGAEVDGYVCAVRNRASKELGGETFISFDPSTDFYKECLVSSEGGDRTALAGRELLIYIPETDDFVTFLFGNKTMRRTADSKFKGIVGKSATIFAKQIVIKDKVNRKTGETIKGTTYKSPNFRFFKKGEGFATEDLQEVFGELQAAIAKFKETEDKLPEQDDDEQDER